MVHTVDSPTVHLPPTVLEADGKGVVEEYDSPDYEGAGGEELLPGSPPSREQSFSAHYDELFELSTDSDDEYDDKPLDSEEYRRIAVDCANTVLLGQDATVAPPAEGESVDAAIYNYCATANADDMYSQGSTWTSVSSDDPAREAAHWKEVAEQGFRESARLRAMVQALRSTFDEVEQENEELHVAYAMQQREILTLGHHLEFKSLEQETLIANFERAMAEMDDTMEDICLEALQADAAAYARDVAGHFNANDAEIKQRERTDWKAKAAGRFAEKKQELAASNATAVTKEKMMKAGARVNKLRKEVKDRAAEVKRDSPKAGRLSKLRGRRDNKRAQRAASPPPREHVVPAPLE